MDHPNLNKLNKNIDQLESAILVDREPSSALKIREDLLDG